MKLIFSCLFILTLFSLSCKKELSLENSKKQTSEGSLQADGTGECLPKTLQGSYVANKALASTNFIEVDVDVTTDGSYIISTDTINGYYFSASGNFSTTGVNTIKLAGQGKPLAEGLDVFTVSFDSTICSIEVNVLPATAGAPAAFTLQTSGTNCNATAAGTFTKGTALNSINKLNLEVNVTTVGSYSITTTATNGMTFTGSGAFSTTGAQTITLTGSGTPVNSGAISIPLSVGSSSCSVTVNVSNSGTTQPPPVGSFFWKFTLAGKTYQGTVDVNNAELGDTTVNGVPLSVFSFVAANAAQDTAISLTLADGSAGIKANDTYTSPPTNTNIVFFTLEDAGGGQYETSTSAFTAKVMAHNTTTKIIEGTFSGTVKEISSGVTKTISGGEFKVNYP